MIQIKDSKSSLIKQQEDWEEMRAYFLKSGNKAYISSKLWDIEQWVLKRFIREIPDGIPQKEGHLEMAKI